MESRGSASGGGFRGATPPWRVRGGAPTLLRSPDCRPAGVPACCAAVATIIAGRLAMTEKSGFDPLTLPESNASGYPGAAPRGEPAALEPPPGRSRAADQFRREPDADRPGRPVVLPPRAYQPGRVHLCPARRGRAGNRCRGGTSGRRDVRRLQGGERQRPSFRQPLGRGCPAAGGRRPDGGRCGELPGCRPARPHGSRRQVRLHAQGRDAGTERSPWRWRATPPLRNDVGFAIGQGNS